MSDREASEIQVIATIHNNITILLGSVHSAVFRAEKRKNKNLAAAAAAAAAARGTTDSAPLNRN